MSIRDKYVRLTWMHVGMFLIIGSIIMIVLSIMYTVHINDYKKAVSVETTAQLVRFVEVEENQEGRYAPEFKYEVNGDDYFVKSKYQTPEKLYKGNGLGYIETIKYNPKKPEESVIVGEEPDSAVWFMLIFIGLFLLGVLIVVLCIKKFVNLGRKSSMI